MFVSVVIVNWNRATLLAGCLEAVLRQSRSPDEIVVVDNGSTDGSQALVAARFPTVRLIPLGVNLGFAAGNNRGIARSRGEIVVTLNNDTIPAPTWLETLCAPLEADAGLGATMSTMLFAHAPDRIASAGIAVGEDGVVLEDLLGYRWTGRQTALRPIFGPSAGAAAYRRALLDDVGAFDDDFFMYLEDADLAWRARLRGWASAHVPQAVTLHVYSASSGQGSPFKSFHLARNRLWCLRKNLPGTLARRYAAAIARYDLGALAYALLARDWASLRGRAAGLRGPAITARRRAIQRRRTAPDSALAEWFVPPLSPLQTLALRRRVDRLAVAKTV